MTPTTPPPTSFARPQRADPAIENRGSLLRASILESALELGFGTNRTVANWIFNSVEELDEDEEPEDIVSPSLTYASTATSEESNLSAGLAQHAQPGAGILGNGKDTHSDMSVQYSRRNGLSPTQEPTQLPLQFDLRASPEPRSNPPAPSPLPQITNKLRKAKKDGYDSDGGYMSESGTTKKEQGKAKDKEKKDKKAKKKGKDTDTVGDGNSGATDYQSDGGHLSEAGGKKKSKKGKKDKSKSKTTESPTSEYETDKSFTSPFRRSRKQSVTSPVSGDESDGGYLSESSKKMRFFRLNSKSRRKQEAVDQPPPVPALPTLSLPIHEKFSRSATPLVPDSRNATPIPSDNVYVRPSMETITSLDTTNTADASITTDASSTTVESEERRDSLISSDGLTRAFQDAESVRSPSTDFLSMFPRIPGSSSRLSPFTERQKGFASQQSPVPHLSSYESVRFRPQISAPNTIALAPKHTPLPLTLTPPTPTSSQSVNRTPPSPDPDYVLVTPNPSIPVVAREGHHSSPSVGSNTSAGSSGGPPSPIMPRPRVLGYYDLPPPSPPPRGPLPDVPSDISRSTSPSWSVMIESSPSSRFPRSVSDINESRGRGLQRAVASPIDRSNPSAPHPLSKEISRDVPTIAQPVPPIQRGRISPFPTAPVLPREQTTTLMRRTSKLTQEAVTRALRNGTAPASASPYMNEHNQWPSHEQVDLASGLASAQPYPDWPIRGPPGAQRQPRSGDDDDGSWLNYDDDDVQGDISDRSPPVSNARPSSTEPPEPSPDVNAILNGFRTQRDAQLSARRVNASTRDIVAGIVAGYARGLDVDEEDGGDRSSVWSETNSRYSFLDGEKSAAIRAKFVSRVETMYGKEVVPPVPRLDEGLRSRSG